MRDAVDGCGLGSAYTLSPFQRGRTSMFSYTVHHARDEVCVALAGEPELADRARLIHVLKGALAGRPRTLRVDMDTVTFIDCAALGALTEVRKASLAAYPAPTSEPCRPPASS